MSEADATDPFSIVEAEAEVRLRGADELAQIPKSRSISLSPAKSPTLGLPKVGGAIRGIGEKSAADHVTGAGSMSEPIATSPGRASCGRQLPPTRVTGLIRVDNGGPVRT
jgi:hypothetical protein